MLKEISFFEFDVICFAEDDATTPTALPTVGKYCLPLQNNAVRIIFVGYNNIDNNNNNNNNINDDDDNDNDNDNDNNTNNNNDDDDDDNNDNNSKKKKTFRTVRGERKKRELSSGWRKPYTESLFNKYQTLLWGESWRWLRNGFLKNETESLILAAQEEALRTNLIQVQHR
mgnify:CR=1 FL=1